MRLLLTNDDGFEAPGLVALIRALGGRHDVVVVAPDGEQSGVSQAITIDRPIMARSLSGNGLYSGWAVKGTPADCVKLAYWELMADRRPDLVVAGINRGANVGLNLFYSGTVAAAREAAMLGLPGVALSLDDHDHDADFSPAAQLAVQLIDRLASSLLDPGRAVNVNIPARPDLPLRLCRLTRQAQTAPKERFISRQDPRGNRYFWQDQEVHEQPPDRLTDRAALANGLISVTPIHFDLTCHHHLDRLGRRLDLPE